MFFVGLGGYNYEFRMVFPVFETFLYHLYINRYNITVMYQIKVRTMDNIDEQIIKLLKNNARISFVDIAEKLKMSEGTIRSRIKKLTEENIIKKFTVITASKNIKAIISVRIDINVNTSDISKKIKKIEGVETVYETSGDDDIAVIVNVMDSDELNSIIEQIRSTSHTLSTKTSMILKELL